MCCLVDTQTSSFSGEYYAEKHSTNSPQMNFILPPQL